LRTRKKRRRTRGLDIEAVMLLKDDGTRGLAKMTLTAIESTTQHEKSSTKFPIYFLVIL